MMRYPVGWAAVGLAALALTVTACGKATGGSAGSGYGAYGNQTTAAAPASSPVQTVALKTETTRAGMVLANGGGLTLYYYSEDKPGSGKSVCTGGCATAWPPLAAPVKAPAGVHLPGPLGMITRPGGVRQVTINGFPVYTYAGDKAPGQATGNGMEGSWHVVKLGGAAGTQAVRALKVEHTSAGTVLASSRGLTLYYYSEDKPGSGKSVCTGACIKAWPALNYPVRAPAGVHLPGKVGYIVRSSGFKQVTINGYPIYKYAGDKAPGQAKGNGIERAWHVIKISKMS
jgi:predicted lipoprotein with Yx(FWY)xxD motif